MTGCNARVAYDVVRNLAVPFLIGTSSIERFVKGTSALEPKIVRYNSKPVPILAINDLQTDQREIMTRQET